MKAQNAKYYKVSLVGVRGTYTILNYYAPNGTIIIPSSIVSQYSRNTYGWIFISPHCVYLAKDFTVPLYIGSNDKQVAMISSIYGAQITVGARIEFK